LRDRRQTISKHGRALQAHNLMRIWKREKSSFVYVSRNTIHIQTKSCDLIQVTHKLLICSILTLSPSVFRSKQQLNTGERKTSKNKSKGKGEARARLLVFFGGQL